MCEKKESLEDEEKALFQKQVGGSAGATWCQGGGKPCGGGDWSSGEDRDGRMNISTGEI